MAGPSLGLLLFQNAATIGQEACCASPTRRSRSPTTSSPFLPGNSQPRSTTISARHSWPPSPSNSRRYQPEDIGPGTVFRTREGAAARILRRAGCLAVSELASIASTMYCSGPAAQLEGNRERLALHCLELGGYPTYLPGSASVAASTAARSSSTPPLFPGLPFVLVELQWHAARWCPGVLRVRARRRSAGTRARSCHRRAQRPRARRPDPLLPPPPDFHHGDRVRITPGARSPVSSGCLTVSARTSGSRCCCSCLAASSWRRGTLSARAGARRMSAPAGRG